MYDDEDLLPVSALQHLVYCERRAFLIHVECAWAENVFTARGAIAHERVHSAGGESRGEVRIARGVRLRSLALGLTGIADVVEFHRLDADEAGCRLPNVGGRWIPYPVEYKSGRSREEPGYEIQLCAQAMCIEEMMTVSVPGGAMFFGGSKRRREILFSDALRQITTRTALRLREVLTGSATPAPVNDARCSKCSLHDTCLPGQSAGRRVDQYIHRILSETPGDARGEPSAP